MGLVRHLAVCLIGLLAACSLQTGRDGAVVGADSDRKSWSASASERVLKAGYVAISERYIDHMSVSEIALLSLKGLARVAPSLSVTGDEARISFSIDAREVAHFLRPSEDDPDGWARLAAEAVATLSKRSQALSRVDAETIYQAMFDAILSQLDEHSRYAGRDQAEKQRALRNGYGGIGLEFRLEMGDLRVGRVYPNSPAQDAGIAAGDLIHRIDGKPSSSMNHEQVREHLRGPLNAPVRLDLLKADTGQRQSLSLTRRKVFRPTVESAQEDGILHLKISGFNRGTSRDLVRALAAAKQGGVRGVILDLRANPGGVFEQAIEISDLFLETGGIVSSHGRHPESLQSYRASPGDLSRGLPVAVLIDGGSASASEIIAAALQDGERGLVIGASSYGKGSIQNVFSLPNEGEMTLTWAHFVAPSGYDLDQVGVLPNICTSEMAANSKLQVNESWLHRAGRHALGQLSQWRRLDAGALERRKDLRRTCASRRRDGNTDLVLARHILKDQTLYRVLLGHRSDFSARLADPQASP